MVVMMVEVEMVTDMVVVHHQLKDIPITAAVNPVQIIHTIVLPQHLLTLSAWSLIQ